MKMVASPKARFYLFLCLTCLALSPTLAAKRENLDLKTNDANVNTTSTPLPESKATLPEKRFWMKRSFAQGQPELQQAMDNMLVREQMIKRNLQFPPVDVDGYPALLTHKTAYLLTEAEHMLNRVKNLRERRWVEAFVHRLKVLASSLEQSAADVPAVENGGLNFTIRGNISLEQELSPVNHLPFTTSPVPVSNTPDVNKEPKTVKIPVTSSQLSQVLPVDYSPNHADSQVVTKPGLMQQLRNKKLDEDDELVRELENLHNVVALENQPQNTTPQVLTTRPPASPAMPNKRMRPMIQNELAINEEKEKIKNILIREVVALQRLGETPEEIMNTLRFDADQFVGFKDTETGFNQNSEKEVPSLETEQNTLENPNTEVKDVQSEELMVGQVNRQIWKPSSLMHPSSHQFKDMYMNKSFPDLPINVHPMNREMLTRPVQNEMPISLHHVSMHLPQHNGIKNAILKLQGHHPDYLLKNHIGHGQQMFQNNHHGIPTPVEANPNLFLQNDGKNHMNPGFGPLTGSGNKHGYYSPYPYFPKINNKNSTLYGTQIFPSSNMDNNFSDEMKRQLRDGKVILLSDSVVRSNFEQTSDKEKDEKDKAEAPDKVIKSEGKNETQAQN